MSSTAEPWDLVLEVRGTHLNPFLSSVTQCLLVTNSPVRLVTSFKLLSSASSPSFPLPCSYFSFFHPSFFPILPIPPPSCSFLPLRLPFLLIGFICSFPIFRACIFLWIYSFCTLQRLERSLPLCFCLPLSLFFLTFLLLLLLLNHLPPPSPQLSPTSFPPCPLHWSICCWSYSNMESCMNIPFLPI